MPRTKLHKRFEEKQAAEAAQTVEAPSVVTTESPDVENPVAKEINPFSIPSDPSQLPSELEFPGHFASMVSRLEGLGFETWLARIGADALCQAKLAGRKTNQYGYLIVMEAERRNVARSKKQLGMA